MISPEIFTKQSYISPKVVEKKRASYLNFVEKYAFSEVDNSKTPSRAVSATSLMSQSKTKIFNKNLAQQSANLNGFLNKSISSLIKSPPARSKKSDILDLSVNDNSRDLLASSETSKVCLKSRTLHKKENVYDSVEEEELSLEEYSSNWIIPFSSKFRRFWDIYIVLVISYVVVMTPFRLAFNLKTTLITLQLLELVNDFSLLADLVLNFFFSYLTANQKEVLSPKKIAFNYVTSWFFFDLISSIPFNSFRFIFGFEEKNYFEVARFFRFYRIIRWIRLLKIFKVLRTKVTTEIDKVSSMHIAFKMLITGGVVFIVMHSFTCLFIFIGMDGHDGWVIVNGMENSSKFDVYIASVYFHVVTMLTVGYGDIKTYTLTERFYACFFLCVGLFLYSCTITVVSSYFSKTTERELKRNTQLGILKDITRTYTISSHLQSEIRANINQQYKKVALERYKLLETLPTKYRNELIYKMHSKHIQHLEFLKNQSHDFIISVLPLMRPLKLTKKDLLLSEGEHVDEMYLVTKGSLTIKASLEGIQYDIAYIRKNYSFGEYFLFYSIQSFYSLHNKQNSTEVLVFKKKDFNQIRIDYNENLQWILKKSHSFIETINKRKNLVKILLKESIDQNEVKKKLNMIDNKIMEQTFKDIFSENINWKSLSREAISECYDQICEILENKACNQEKEIKNFVFQEEKRKSEITEAVSIDQLIENTVRRVASAKETESDLEVISWEAGGTLRKTSNNMVRVSKKKSTLFSVQAQRKFETVVEKRKPVFKKISFGFSINRRKEKLVAERAEIVEIKQGKRVKNRSLEPVKNFRNRMMSLNIGSEKRKVTKAARNIVSHNRSSVLGMDFLKYELESSQFKKETNKIKRALSKVSGIGTDSSKKKLTSDLNKSCFVNKKGKRTKSSFTDNEGICSSCNQITVRKKKASMFSNRNLPLTTEIDMLEANNRVEDKLDKLLNLIKELT